MRPGVRWILGIAGVVSLGAGVGGLIGWPPAGVRIETRHEEVPDGDGLDRGTITMTQVIYDGGWLGAGLLIAAGATALYFACRRPRPAA